MKNIIRKNIKILLFLIAISGTAIHFYWLDGLVWAFAELVLGETTYSPDYREYKFRRIRIGMSEEEVVEILGKPLEKPLWRKNKIPNSWYYAYGKNTLENKYPNEYFFTVRIIHFNNGKVVDVLHGFYWD